MINRPIPIDRTARRRRGNLPVARELTRVRAWSFDFDSPDLAPFIEAAFTLELMMSVENFVNDEGEVAVEVVTYLERIPITTDQVDGCWQMPEHWSRADRTDARERDLDWFLDLSDDRWQTHQARAVWLHVVDDDARGHDEGERDGRDRLYTWFAEFSDVELHRAT